VSIIVEVIGPTARELVQNVEVLPFNTALKFTVAKYYALGTLYSRESTGREVD
jgi:hypothetical protein